MRLTVNLDAENYALAKSLAKAEDCTLSITINRLIRKAVAPPSSKKRPVTRNGFPVSRGATPVTPELVRQVEEEMS
jgi:hypothetical protein